MARILASILVVATVLLGATQAFADAAGDLGVEIVTSVSGSDLPGLTLRPKVDVKKVVISLVRNDKKTQKLAAANIQAGSTKMLPVQQEAGEFSYTGTFDVTWGDGSTSDFTMRFTLTKVKKLELSLKPEDVDLDARTMKFTVNNPVKMVELIIVGQDGKPLKHVKKQLGSAGAGQPIELSWPDPGDDVLYMDLKVHDVAGFWKGIRLTPFSISIPHDDVVFDSGKWNIKKSEEAKLEATMKQIKDALAKHGTLLTLKLYIAGYTDTVGSKGSNETLSRNRARSIASWFRAHGLKIPIFYQGFGERVLAKATPDETDEAANRRAVYILSSQIPAKGGQIPDDKWSGL